jgi:hypothetical protein
MLRRAGSRNRTGDLLITSQLLYQLSYAGLEKRAAYYMRDVHVANRKQWKIGRV